MNEPSIKQNPYVGLKPFDEENSRYFFGRDEDIRIAANNLRAASVTIYYGASGVGKTSLINAGVIPYLRKAATTSIPGKKPEFILVALRDWANDPLKSLRNRIKIAIDEAFAKINEKEKLTFTKDDIENEYARSKENGSLIRLLKNWNKLTKINFLIILDQFEIFLSDTESKSEYKTGKGSFGDELAKVLNATDLPANLMISLRDDALAQMDFLKDKAPELMKNTLRLDHLDRRSARDAIVKPLMQYNSENENSSFRITGKLLKNLLEELKVGKINFDANVESEPNQIQSKTATDKIETPFLQLVMNRLWTEVKDKKEKSEQIITFAALEKFKGAEEPNPVKNIVKTYLDEVMSGFTDAQKIAASKFIHFTVSSSGAKRSSTIEDLTKYTDGKVSEDEIRAIMKELAGDKRVFKAVDNRANPTKPFYEVTHDAIVPAVLSWREREYQKIEQQEKLAEEENLRFEQEAKLKDQEKRLAEEQRLRLIQEKLLDEERSRLIESKRSRVRGRWIWILSILLITAAISGGYFYQTKENSEYSKDKLTEKLNETTVTLEKEVNTLQNTVDHQKNLIQALLKLSSDDSAKIDEALNQLKVSAENGEVSEEYKGQFEKLLNNKIIAPRDKAKLELTKEAIKVSAPKFRILKTIAPALIFIQFQKDDDQPKAANLRSFLNKQNGFLAPGVENVGDHPEITNIQLRYFRGDDSDATLNRVSECLEAIGIKSVKMKIPGYEESSLIRPNQFELWFTNDGIPNISETSGGKCSDLTLENAK